MLIYVTLQVISFCAEFGAGLFEEFGADAVGDWLFFFADITVSCFLAPFIISVHRQIILGELNNEFYPFKPLMSAVSQKFTKYYVLIPLPFLLLMMLYEELLDGHDPATISLLIVATSIVYSFVIVRIILVFSALAVEGFSSISNTFQATKGCFSTLFFVGGLLLTIQLIVFGAVVYGLSALALNPSLTEFIEDSLHAIGTLLYATVMPLMASHAYMALGLHQQDPHQLNPNIGNP